MIDKLLFCIADTRDRADEIVSRLQEAGFPDTTISVLFPYESRRRMLARRPLAPCGTGTMHIYRRSGVARLPVTASLAIPDAGLLVAAGGLAAGICVAAGGAEPGGIAEALIALGLDEEAAANYERKIHAGHILLSVNAEEPAAEKTARLVLEEAGAENIAASGAAPSSALKPEGDDTFAHHE